MQVEFHGAAGEVTGSMHLVHAAGRRVLLDCGLLQGRRELEARNADPFPFEPASLDALVLSHAHIDHIGRVPLLVARGFDGPIWLHGATADLLPVMLEDAASLAESEAQRANRHRDPEQPPMPPVEGQSQRFAAAASAAFMPRTMRDSPNLMLAEAGTGIGKTLGYLAPAALYAQETGGSVWLSTYTRALQRQLKAETARRLPLYFGVRSRTGAGSALRAIHGHDEIDEQAVP